VWRSISYSTFAGFLYLRFQYFNFLLSRNRNSCLLTTMALWRHSSLYCPPVVTGEKNSPTVAHACRKKRLKWVLPQVEGWSTGLATLSLLKKINRYRNLNNCKVVEALRRGVVSKYCCTAASTIFGNYFVETGPRSAEIFYHEASVHLSSKRFFLRYGDFKPNILRKSVSILSKVTSKNDILNSLPYNISSSFNNGWVSVLLTQYKD
jgi:hypothetical protein